MFDTLTSPHRKRGDVMNKFVLMNDVVAKKIFKNSSVSKELTARLVSEILKVDYQDIYDNMKLISEEVAFSALTVNSTTDMMLESNSIYVDIEICYTEGMVRDTQTSTYVFQIFLSQIKNYQDYKNVKKVIQILIEGYDYFNRNRFIYDVVFMEKNLHIEETNSITKEPFIEKFHVNLAYLYNLGYNKIIEGNDSLSKLLYFLICDNEELDKLYDGDKFMKKVVKEAKEIAGLSNLNLYISEEDVRRLDGELKYEKGFKDGKEEGIQEGLQKGIQEGILQSKQDMVINFYNNNVSVDIIAKSTNLTPSQVNEIIQNEKNKSK